LPHKMEYADHDDDDRNEVQERRQAVLMHL